MRLAEKVAIVTGGGRGIGRAIARRFAEEGAATIVTARTEREVAAVVDEITSDGGTAVGVAADVSRESDCDRVVAAARDALGPVDILVNNAGIYGPLAPLEELATDDWDEAIAINLRGPFLMMRAILPEMYKRHTGAIVNISSIAAKTAYPWNAPYAASKAGLLALNRTVAAEAAREGVRVNAICPGPVVTTRMSQELGQTLADRLGVHPEAQLAQYLDGVLQGRSQTEEEIAAAVLFLVSEEASAITAQSLNVDGGIVFG